MKGGHLPPVWGGAVFGLPSFSCLLGCAVVDLVLQGGGGDISIEGGQPNFFAVFLLVLWGGAFLQCRCQKRGATVASGGHS